MVNSPATRVCDEFPFFVCVTLSFAAVFFNCFFRNTSKIYGSSSDLLFNEIETTAFCVRRIIYLLTTQFSKLIAFLHYERIMTQRSHISPEAKTLDNIVIAVTSNKGTSSFRYNRRHVMTSFPQPAWVSFLFHCHLSKDFEIRGMILTGGDISIMMTIITLLRPTLSRHSRYYDPTILFVVYARTMELTPNNGVKKGVIVADDDSVWNNHDWKTRTAHSATIKVIIMCIQITNLSVSNFLEGPTITSRYWDTLLLI